ncbi:MAG: hypothetical protein MRJ68_20190 [Nitrospira sp.]|nr:hypothetical protein [Nitrospira sp.]
MTRIMIFLLVWGLVISGWASENPDTKGAFERDLFSPIVVSPFGIDEHRFKALSFKQRQDLLDARQVLVKFLKASQSHSPNIHGLVASPLLDRFPDQAALLDKLFGRETEVVLGSITDFVISSANEIELSYYIVVFAEGNTILNQDKALLRRDAAKWLIVRIGGLQ